MARSSLALALGVLAAGCAAHRPMATVEIEQPTPPVAGPSWQAIASAEDQARIAALRATWIEARRTLPPRAAKQAADEGALLDPDAALDLPALTPGPYACRLVRIGGRAAIRSFAPDLCYVQGDKESVSLTKQTGETLPGGWLYPDGDRRLVFLGTFRERASVPAAAYGQGAARDLAGVVERVGPFRWRFMPAQPGGGARLDVYELVPIVQPARTEPAQPTRRRAR